LALDFMHFTESRLGLVDTFLVCFVLLMVAGFWRWFSLMRDGPSEGCAAPDPRAYGWLLLSGLGMALGAATKWNALYPGLALAILFFVAVAGYWRAQTKAARPKGKSGRPGRRADAPVKPPRGWLPATLGVALLAFAVLPAAVYYASYVPYFLVPGHTGGIAEVIEWQKKMWSYHADLNVAHDFASAWWQWPLLYKPLWAYTARDTMPAGVTATVAAFGNPLIWLACFPAIAAAAWMGIRRRDRALVFLLAVLLAQYLPWIVAPRKVTFIYHFYPMVPILCLLIVRLLQLWWDGRRDAGRSLKPLRVAYGIYFGLAIALFVAFYPVISGATVPADWVKYLHWSPSWFF
jgi:dolichyl-phosphate-mannose--protein O-mannosyl transferase